VLSTISGMPCSWAIFGERLEVRHVEARVADGLDVERLGLRRRSPSEVLRIVALDELHADAEPRERHLELVVGAAVEVAGRDDVVAGLGDGGDRQELRRLAGADVASAATPPSSAAMRCSKTSVVGFMIRV
jgi:hypothetical protein